MTSLNFLLQFIVKCIMARNCFTRRIHELFLQLIVEGSYNQDQNWRMQRSKGDIIRTPWSEPERQFERDPPRRLRRPRACPPSPARSSHQATARSPAVPRIPAWPAPPSPPRSSRPRSGSNPGRPPRPHGAPHRTSRAISSLVHCFSIKKGLLRAFQSHMQSRFPKNRFF